MAQTAIQAPGVILNDELIKIVPNSLKYTEGLGETVTTVIHGGGSNTETISVTNQETAKGMLSFDVKPTKEALERLRAAKVNIGGNVVGWFDSASKTDRTISNASIINNYEVPLGADTVITVEFEGNQVISRHIIDNPGHHPGFLPQFLKEKKVNIIVAGGMGQRAQILFNENGIKAIMGIEGKVDEVIKKVAAGTLKGEESFCKPGAGKGYGLDKTICSHSDQEECDH